ncbi:hypothetical protein FGO68_gene14566 [Halteria grandinella]|uniref:Zinc finger PHD-type domain-containing protein n=1 Tax=Halteria grandinella TaxID=5974 RepID=A0A8J8T4G4_HALGN|nr:hypothetical protein FGO68_gene14566 [Halteria grandinella]
MIQNLDKVELNRLHALLLQAVDSESRLSSDSLLQVTQPKRVKQTSGLVRAIGYFNHANQDQDEVSQLQQALESLHIGKKKCMPKFPDTQVQPKVPPIGYVMYQEQAKYHWYSYNLTKKIQANSSKCYVPCFICLLYITYDGDKFIDRKPAPPHHERCFREISPSINVGMYNSVQVSAQASFINVTSKSLCEACGKCEPDVMISLSDESDQPLSYKLYHSCCLFYLKNKLRPKYKHSVSPFGFIKLGQTSQSKNAICHVCEEASDSSLMIGCSNQGCVKYFHVSCAFRAHTQFIISDASIVNKKFAPDKYGLLCDDHRTFQSLAKPLDHPVYQQKPATEEQGKTLMGTGEATEVIMAQPIGESLSSKAKAKGASLCKEEVKGGMERRIIDSVRSIYLKWLQFGIVDTPTHTLRSLKPPTVIPPQDVSIEYLDPDHPSQYLKTFAHESLIITDHGPSPKDLLTFMSRTFAQARATATDLYKENYREAQAQKLVKKALIQGRESAEVTKRLQKELSKNNLICLWRYAHESLDPQKHVCLRTCTLSGEDLVPCKAGNYCSMRGLYHISCVSKSVGRVSKIDYCPSCLNQQLHTLGALDKLNRAAQSVTPELLQDALINRQIQLSEAFR